MTFDDLRKMDTTQTPALNTERVEALLSDIAISLRTIEEQARVNSKPVLNAEETADYLGVTIQHIYRLTSKKEIPHYKRGKSIFFNREELNAWLQEERIDTLAEIEDRALQYIQRHQRR